MDITKLVPIDFSRKITPFIAGDFIFNSRARHQFNLSDTLQISKFNSGEFENPENLGDVFYVISYADRSNTGKQPVSDDVVVDRVLESTDDDDANVKTCKAKSEWCTDWELKHEEANIKTWKPNHAAMLKQHQESLLAEEAERMNNVARNGNCGEHYNEVEQAHHVALQMNELGDRPKPLDIVINPDVKSFDEISDSIEAAIERRKPTDYKPWDGKESLDIGMAYTNGGGIDCMFIGIHAGIIIGRPIDMTCHNRLYLSTSDKTCCKPIKSDEDKLRDALSVIANLPKKTSEVVDALLSSDKFEIKLKG